MAPPRCSLRDRASTESWLGGPTNLAAAPRRFYTSFSRKGPTMIVQTQRRKSYRRRVHLDYCQVLREHDFRVVSTMALDISSQGALVRTTLPVLTGEEIILSLRPAQRSHWLDLLGTVTRVVHGRRKSDKGRCLGLEFYGIDEAARRALLPHLRSPELKIRPRVIRR